MRVVASGVAIPCGCPESFYNAIWTSTSYTEKHSVLGQNTLLVKSPGKTRTSEENVNRIRKAFQWNPCKSIRAAVTKSTFNSPRCATQKAPHQSYKIQTIHALKPSDQVTCKHFAVDMLERNDASPDFLRQVCFSDEARIHVNGVANRYNCRIGAVKIHMSHVSWTEAAQKWTCGLA
jgi:hypothetical protein